MLSILTTVAFDILHSKLTRKLVKFYLFRRVLLLCKLLLTELQRVKLIIPSLLLQQLLVIALLHDHTLGQQDDIVRMLDRGQTVGYYEHGADILDLLQGILDQQLGLGINIGSSFIQNDHGRLVDNGAGKAKELSLTCREIVASLLKHFVQALLQFVDKGICIHIAAGLHHFFIGNSLFPQQNIASDIPGEQEHILEHLTEVLSQGGNLNLLNVNLLLPGWSCSLYPHGSCKAHL